MKPLVNIIVLAGLLWMALGRIIVPQATELMNQYQEHVEEEEESAYMESQLEAERDESLNASLEGSITNLESVLKDITSIKADIATLKATPVQCPVPQDIYDKLKALNDRMDSVEDVEKRQAVPPSGMEGKRDRRGWHDVDRKILTARSEDKHLLIFVRQTSCPPCDTFERNVLNTAAVEKRLRDFQVAHINTDKQEDQAIAARFKIASTPAMIEYLPGKTPNDAQFRVYDRTKRDGTAWLPETPIVFLGILGV